MLLGTVLLIVLDLILIGGFSGSRRRLFCGIGGFGAIAVIVLVPLVLGKVSHEESLEDASCARAFPHLVLQHAPASQTLDGGRQTLELSGRRMNG